MVSNSVMSNPDSHHAHDQRLTDLEIKATFTEDVLEQFDAVIVRQQAQIDMLIAQVRQLRQSQAIAASPAGDAEDAGDTSLRNDLPPHF